MHGGTEKMLLEQVQELVGIPSQAGVDEYGPILQAVLTWLGAHGVEGTLLFDDTRPVGVWGAIRGKAEGRICMLNATVDTAPVGDLDNWTRHPLSAHIDNGWLYGRGSADSKAGIAVFCHVLAALASQTADLRGSLVFLFDAEEHSGVFGGIRRFLEARPESLPRGGVMIGYPGDERIVIGCRGFFRATITVYGVAAHSGSSSHRGVNAIARAADLVRRIEALPLPASGGPDFPMPAKVTVTGMHGGDGFSTVPDRCRVQVDFRLTPLFTHAHAEAALASLVEELDAGSDASPTLVEPLAGWPAYRLTEQTPVYSALRSATRDVFGQAVPGGVAGPSSIGNYLATLGVDATSGFGVRYRNIHAANECFEIATLEPTFQTYLRAAQLLLR